MRRLRKKTVAFEKLDIAISTLDKMIKNGEFPKPKPERNGGKSVFWLESDVDKWIKEWYLESA